MSSSALSWLILLWTTIQIAGVRISSSFKRKCSLSKTRVLCWKKIQNRITCLSLSSYGIASITWGLLCFLPFQDTDANFKYWMGSTLQFKSELFWEGTPPNQQIFFSCRLGHVQSLCINKHILSGRQEPRRSRSWEKSLPTSLQAWESRRRSVLLSFKK